MKCPKCGYNSFEYYDNCKKCSNDLTGYKLTHSITPLVLPLEIKAMKAAEFQSSNKTDVADDSSASNAGMFSFDISDEAPAATAATGSDPFDFDASGTGDEDKSGGKPEYDPFSDLLETTSHSDDSPFGTAKADDAFATSASGKPSLESDGFELETFSWDETPTAAAAGGGKSEDDFDSLFGETKEPQSK